MLCDSLPYIILRRIVPGPKTALATQLLRNTDVTMARSGFGLYHGLRRKDAHSKHIGVITTPWTMMRALGFIDILQAHK